MNILLINLAFIGDVLLSTPVARALREKYPQAQIDMLTVPLTQPIAAGNPYIDEVLVYDKRGQHKKLGELWQLLRLIRRRKYDLAVSTNFASRGAILAWAAGIGCRVGYDIQQAGWFLTHKAAARRDDIRHEAENYLAVLSPLGITTADTSLAFRIQPQDEAGLQVKLERDWNRPLTLLCPVGSYPQKSWTLSGYTRLVQALSAETDCYLLGGRQEKSQLQQISQAAGGTAKVLAGVLTLGELAALLARARLLVTVDTGPMHLACAVGTPVAAFFGPTDPRIWGPRGKEDVVFQTVACQQAFCWGRVPCFANRCLQELDEDFVIKTVLNMLQ